jgi:glycosyltransferase involved in cell wall biosynthesis
MKVAHVVCAFPPYKGGMGNSVNSFAKILAKMGHNVTVFTPLNGDNQTEFVTDNSGVVAGGKSGRLQVERIKSLIKFGHAAFLPGILWRLNGFDIIHLHYPFYGAAEVVLLKKLISPKKSKLIIHYHMEPTAKGLKGLAFRLYQLFFMPLFTRIADIITCASVDYVKHSGLATYYEKNKNKFWEVPFGVGVEKFRQRTPVHGRQIERKNILFVGGLDRAHYFKGVDVLLKAIRKLEIGNWKLEIVGDGDLRPEYEKLARELGISDKVEFAGRVEDDKLPSYYQNSDVFVLPSVNQGEAFGLVLLEAMACGVPVIASDLPGVRRVFKDGKQGLLAKPGDIDDLAEKIKIILGDENLAKKMGKEGRKLVEEKYTWEKVGERLDRVYKVVKSIK